MNQPSIMKALGDAIHPSFGHGSQVAIAGGATRPTFEIVHAALRASWTLGGQRVRCSDVLPGVVMRVSVDASSTTPMVLQDGLARAIWQALRPQLLAWLNSSPQTNGFKVTLDRRVHFEFGWSDKVRLLDAAVHLLVRHDDKFRSRYLKQRRRFSLVEHDDGASDIHRDGMLLLSALQKGIQTNDIMYARLPPPVRYRVTGAQEAWRSFRRRVDASSSTSPFEVLDYSPITTLVKIFGNMVKDVFPQGTPEHSQDALALQASHSAVWQAFEIRNGVFYEPSAALHQLLDASYIADDVSIGHLQLPVDALCIIPEPSRWGRPGGCESIVMFKSRSFINCVTWTHRDDPERSVVMDVIELSLADPDRTIRELLDDAFQSPAADIDEIRQHWRSSLDYAIKMLLYLSLRNAQVTHDRAYSEAPRNFTGLGRRKREGRLAEIEELYDRHIVGPALLDELPERAEPGESGTREVSSHWRRPHFRMQAHGPRATQRKLVFIGPTIVRADRLTG